MNCKSVECQTENEQQSGERERERERERDPGLGNVEGWRVRLLGALDWILAPQMLVKYF